MKLLLVLSMALSGVSVAQSEEVLASPSTISICVGEPQFVGEYAVSNEVADGVPTYSNANDMSFFRNNGFW